MSSTRLPLLIRLIGEDDLPDALMVYRQSQDFLALGPQPIASEAMVKQDIDISHHKGGLFCGIFHPDCGLIGVIDFIPNNFEGRFHQASIALFMIAAPYRRRGIGQQVLAQIHHEILKDPQVDIIITAVQVNNPQALHFWQKNGYQIAGGLEAQPDTTVTYRLHKSR